MASPSATAGPLPLLQRLKNAAGDDHKISVLIKEAESLHGDDQGLVAEVYGIAVDVCGHMQSSKEPREATSSDHWFLDLCVKRMRALVKLNRTREAREFHNRLRICCDVGRADARMYEARATMEERLGDTAKASKMLQEGLHHGARPAELLRRCLDRLQAAPAAEAAVDASAPAAPAAPTRRPPPVPASNSTAVAAASAAVAAAARATAAAPVQAPTPARAGGARAPPRILGLGDPMRRLPEDEADEDEEEDPAARPEAWVPGAMSLMPLSPIKEVDSPGRTSRRASALTMESETADSVPPTVTPLRPQASSTPGPAAARPAALASPAAVAPQRSCHETPRPDAAALSRAGGSAEPASAERSEASAKGSKTVVVNGVPYTQIQTIGRGGSSKVYLVQGPRGEVCALKRVTTENAKQLEAFQNEVGLLMQLRNQERVIQVFDAEVDRERGRINIVMEAGDMDLSRFLQGEPNLSLSQIQHLWRQMLEAVRVIHGERIVHSDLKPQNFLLVKGKLKVIDFGIARKINNDTTNISRDASIGTLSYMAPEAVRTGQVKMGRPSDIWSLGVILYQMVYGHPPFANMEPMQKLMTLNDPQLSVQFPPSHRVSGHSATTKAQLMDVLGRCLQRDPFKRPSLDWLLAHPFLAVSATVRRDQVEDVVRSLMAGVLGAVPGAEPKEAKWQVLADEVWERLAGFADPGEAFSGLEPLKASLASRARPRSPSADQDAVLRRAMRPLCTDNAANIALGTADAGRELDLQKWAVHRVEKENAPMAAQRQQAALR